MEDPVSISRLEPSSLRRFCSRGEAAVSRPTLQQVRFEKEANEDLEVEVEVEVEIEIEVEVEVEVEVKEEVEDVEKKGEVEGIAEELVES